MKRTKKYIDVVIIILLSFTILITMSSAFVKLFLTNKEIYLHLLEATNTYSAVTDALYGKMNSVLGNDISEDLKKSIITEDDVRKEADVVLDCMINNLINGQSNVPQISTDVYKERIVQALNSLTGYDAYINKRKDLASSPIMNGYTIEPMKLIIGDSKNINSINLKVDNSNNISDDLFFEKLATRAELEEQGRAMLKEKGMTEEQARAKLAEKGISEEQAWQYLRDNGYLDEENESAQKQQASTDSNNIPNDETTTDANKVPDTKIKSNDKNVNQGESENNINSLDSSQKVNSQSEDIDDSKISKKKIQNIVMSIILDKNMSFDEKMDKIYSELMNEAEIIINKEMSNLNCSQLINSSMFYYTVKSISILYKLFYINLLVLVILIVVLGIVNNFNFIKIINYLSKSTLISGILSTVIFGFIYLSKAYMKFSGIANKSYFKPMFLASSEYFCRILFITSAEIFIVGLIMNVFMIKKRLNRR